MKEMVATVTTKGQLTLPVEVRRHLGIKPNDKVAFVIEDDGTVHVSAPKYPNIASLRGAAGKLPQPLSWPEMRDIAREERLANKYGKMHE
jgi:AbrB family looped-hinge helix DNA binding protein